MGMVKFGCGDNNWSACCGGPANEPCDCKPRGYVNPDSPVRAPTASDVDELRRRCESNDIFGSCDMLAVLDALRDALARTRR